MCGSQDVDSQDTVSRMCSEQPSTHRLLWLGSLAALSSDVLSNRKLSLTRSCRYLVDIYTR